MGSTNRRTAHGSTIYLRTAVKEKYLMGNFISKGRSLATTSFRLYFSDTPSRFKETRSTSVPWSTTKAEYIVFIQSSFNNTILSLSNLKGDILAWASAGSVGFRKSRRSSNVAAQATGQVVARKALERGIHLVDVHLKGLGFSKESALRGLQLGGLRFSHLCDITSMPHNGCRPPKKRRV